MRFTIYGHCQSKSNTRRWTGRVFIKSERAMTFIREALPQIPVMNPLMTGPVKMDIRIYYPSFRNDLDETLVLDLLQGRIYKNDRQVKERHTYHGVDRVNPRVELEIMEL